LAPPKIALNQLVHRREKMKELPNFAAWSNKNLANFCTDAYIRMQEQQEAIEQLRQNWKDAMEITRQLMLKDINDRT